MLRPDNNYFITKGITYNTRSFFETGYMDPQGNIESRYESFLRDKLTTMKNSGKRFRNHILVPIFDTWGGLVSIYGRNLNPMMNKLDSKGDNTPFTKSDIVYGLNLAIPHILKRGFATVVEGPFDAMGMWQGEVKNCISTLGTSLSISQLVQLSFFTDTLILMYDGDEAGYKKMFDIYNKYYKDINILFCILPRGYDPDEYIIRHGKDSLTDRIFSYEDLLDSNIRQRLLN